MSENHNLKSILGNLEERMNTISRRNSTERSPENSIDSKRHLKTSVDFKNRKAIQHKTSNPLTERPKGEHEAEKWDKYTKTNYHD